MRVCINIAEETFEPAFIDERIALKIEEDVAGGRFWQTGKPEAQGHRQELVENFPDLTSIDLQPSLLADSLIGNSQCVMSDPASAVIFLSAIGLLTAVVIALAAFLETGSETMSPPRTSSRNGRRGTRRLH